MTRLTENKLQNTLSSLSGLKTPTEKNKYLNSFDGQGSDTSEPAADFDDLFTNWVQNEPEVELEFLPPLDFSELLANETLTARASPPTLSEVEATPDVFKYQQPPSISPRHEPLCAMSLFSQDLCQPISCAKNLFADSLDFSGLDFDEIACAFTSESEPEARVEVHDATAFIKEEEMEEEQQLQQPQQHLQSTKEFNKDILNAFRNKHFAYKHSACLYCNFQFKSAPTRADFINHVRAAHPRHFAYCQWRRVESHELPAPEGVVIERYLLDIITFIADSNADIPDTCFVPGCQRRGRDRNITTGHLRQQHQKTYRYCQELAKSWEVKDIQRVVEKLEDEEVFDVASTRRSYNYKKPSRTQDSAPRASSNNRRLRTPDKSSEPVRRQVALDFNVKEDFGRFLQETVGDVEAPFDFKDF